MAQLLLLAATFANIAFAAPGAVCSSAPYKGFLPLSSNAFVQSFCTKNFPVPPVTVTPSTSFVTTTSTVYTTTTISTTTMPTSTLTSTETDTETLTATLTTTSTDTATSTQTSTVVTNANGATYKRDAAPLPTAMVELDIAARAATGIHGFASNTRAQSASAAFAGFSSIAGSIKATISTACSCVETPKTLSTTATSTVKATSTSTLSTTTTFTSPTSITTTVTTTTTTTSTSTSTSVAFATTTSVVQFNACGQNFAAPYTGTPLGVRCGQQITGSYSLLSSQTTDSFYACMYAGDQVSESTSFTFQFSTKTCRIYYNNGPNSQYVADGDYVYGYYFP